MEKSISYNFSQGLSSLEDLKTLLNSDLYQFVDQAIFHLKELKYSLLNEIKSLNSYQIISEYLKVQVQSYIFNSLKESNHLTQVSLIFNEKELSLHSWDRILSMLPQFLELIEIFNFKRNVLISIGKGSIELMSTLDHKDQESWQDEFKFKVYKLTRALLNNKYLLTYKIDDSETDELFKITISLDYSYEESNVYCIEAGEKQDILVGFPNIFENYHVADDSIHLYNKFPCIEITTQLNIVRHQVVPTELGDFQKKVENTKTLLHFPFLFRPISLIIPKRGKIFPTEKLSSEFTNSNEANQDENNREGISSKTPIFYRIDFFSFLES